MPSTVLSTVSSSEIFTQTSEKVLYLDVSITKNIFCCKVSTIFSLKSEELFLTKRNRLRVHIENATVSLHRQKNAVFYASITNYTP